MGNLFNHTMGEGFPIEFAELSGQLQDKGVTMTCLQISKGKALIYIYRVDELEKVSRDAGVQQLLATCGYSCFDVRGALEMLRMRLRSCNTFPHEIGIFLGYPLEDVLGFRLEASLQF